MERRRAKHSATRASTPNSPTVYTLQFVYVNSLSVIVAEENFTITIASNQVNFVVKDFSTFIDSAMSGTARNGLELLALHDTNIADLISASAFSNYDTSIVPGATNSTSARLRFAYQNQSNNRFGEIATIDFDKETGLFSRVDNKVFSEFNPSHSINTSSALLASTWNVD